MEEGREYDGVLLLQGIADYLGLPVGQLNFFAGCCVSLLLAVAYRKWLAVPSVSTDARHLFNVITGVIIVTFAVGWDVRLLLLKTVLCYVLMLCLPAAYVHIGVFILAFVFLCLGHIYMMIYPFKVPSLDVTYPLMVTTQKLTTLGFNLADWYRYGNTPDKMTPEQRTYAVRRFPSVLEFCSYLLGFQSVVIGPFSFYNDYMAFVEGTHISQQLSAAGAGSNANYKLDAQRVPSPNKAVQLKVWQCIFWIAVHVTLPPLLPVANNADPSFLHNHGILFRIVHCVFSLFCYRSRYYFGWIAADAINNAAGFGFSGFDENGNAKWDMLTNCQAWQMELATSFKTYVASWNLCTTRWLRFICYSRAPFSPTLATFLLSAVWHGFWPGYYVMFLTAAVFTFAARKWRRLVRPLFQTSRARSICYDVATWLATQMAIAYITVPFVILRTSPILTFYSHWHWCLHILAVAVLLWPSSSKLPYSPVKPQMEASNCHIKNGHASATFAKSKTS